MALPQFANGGSIGAGQLSIVGERGPELFLPKSSGTIIPNHSLSAMSGDGGGSVQINNYVTVQGGGGTKEQNEDLSKRMINELNKMAESAVGDQIRKQKRPGGLLAGGAY